MSRIDDILGKTVHKSFWERISVKVDDIDYRGFIIAKQKAVLEDGISVTENHMKPEKIMYQRLLEKYNLDPAESIFIDNQPENTHVAAQSGIPYVILKKTHHKFDLIRQLVNSSIDMINKEKIRYHTCKSALCRCDEYH